MARIWTYLVTLTLISFILGMFGFSTIGSAILTRLGLSLSSGTTGFVDSIFWFFTFKEGGGGIIGLATGGGLLIGLLTKNSRIGFAVGFSTVLVGFIGDFSALIMETASISGGIRNFMIIVFGALLVGYAYSIVEWFMQYGGS